VEFVTTREAETASLAKINYLALYVVSSRAWSDDGCVSSAFLSARQAFDKTSYLHRFSSCANRSFEVIKSLRSRVAIIAMELINTLLRTSNTKSETDQV
jgi:hypothetical protein